MRETERPTTCPWCQSDDPKKFLRAPGSDYYCDGNSEYHNPWHDVVESVSPTVNVQFWLAELDQYGNPTLIDGAHSDAAGANKAAFLIQSMKLGKPNRKFAVARVELSECKPSAEGVNMEAVAAVNRMKEGRYER